jgi:hypothetical protein
MFTCKGKNKKTVIADTIMDHMREASDGKAGAFKTKSPETLLHVPGHFHFVGWVRTFNYRACNQVQVS